MIGCSPLFTFIHQMTIYENQKWLALNKVERAAIEKRYLGKSYHKIEEELIEEFGNDGFTLGTLKHYFSEGGKLFELYIWYATEINSQRDKEARIYWESCLVNAVAVVADVMNDDKNPRRLAAALAVIESNWGKTYQPLHLSGEVSIADKYSDMTTEELEDYVDELSRAAYEEQGEESFDEYLASEVANAEAKLERLKNTKIRLNINY